MEAVRPHVYRTDARWPKLPPTMLQPHRALVTGQTTTHLSVDDMRYPGTPMHQDVVAPFLRLRQDAEAAGFDLRILSGFRDFERQSSIWNRKATGQLTVLDSYATPVSIDQLDEYELVLAILRWSALPGASRHHWGTDLDVYDENTRPEGYEVDLIPAEVEGDGMFAPLHEWLDQRISAGESHGFFRPYDLDRGGVAPERWHLSHGPVADQCEKVLTVEALRETIAESSLELKSTVTEHLSEIYQRFVINTSPSPP